MRRATDPSERDRARAELPSREQQWDSLISALRAEGEVREVAPGRIELREPDGDGLVIVVTPDQWERVLLDHARGDLGMYFADLLGPREEDETFIVFYNGDLARSTREELPPIRSTAFERRIAELRAQNPEAKLGWVAYPPEKTESPDD